MKLKESFKMLTFVLALPVLFSACDSDNSEDGVPLVATKGVFVFNTGNQGTGVDGSLSFIDEKTNTVTSDVFQMVNGRSLGSTVQDGVILGNHLYIAVSKSNTIEVVHKNTLMSVAQIRPTTDQGSSPRDIVTDGKYVYVSMYSGHVSRIDPATNTIDKTVAVGPNPEEMVIANNHLYVVNSDGNNWQAGYANGKSVSKISLSSLDEKKIAVGLNPTKIVADVSGNVIVLCVGDYDATPAALWLINKEDEAKNWGKAATFMAIKDNSLYAIDAPFGSTTIEYSVYNTQTGNLERDNFVSLAVDSPAGMAIDPDNGRIFITSYTLVGGFTSYTTPGYVNEYTSDGTFVQKYNIGVGPSGMIFLK